ncbi:MAG: hypothetical protein K5683_00780, partial [Prevotella sp.]|nr:hypothetical protein [Prevotella sp.]
PSPKRRGGECHPDEAMRSVDTGGCYRTWYWERKKRKNFRAFRFFGFFSEFKKKLVEGLWYLFNENEKGKRGKGEKGKSSVFATARFGVFANVLLVASLCKSGKPITFSRFAL